MLVLMSETLRADLGQHALAILDLHGQAHGIRRLVAAVVSHSTSMRRSGIEHQVEDVRAGRRVHRHTLAAGDVADDLLAANRVAALRAEHHHVVGAAHLDLVAGAARAQHALDGGDDRRIRRLLLQLRRRHRLLQDRPRRELAVADVREQLVARLRAVLGRELEELVALEQRLRDSDRSAAPPCRTGAVQARYCGCAPRPGARA